VCQFQQEVFSLATSFSLMIAFCFAGQISMNGEMPLIVCTSMRLPLDKSLIVKKPSFSIAAIQ
jgi:hypothetical protein